MGGTDEGGNGRTGRTDKRGGVKKKERPGILKLFGHAMGVMRMSYRDFFRMTPEEFGEAAKAFRDHEERMSRERWEIMRMEASILIQPYVKKKLTARELLEFPWERNHIEEAEAPEENLTVEQRKRLAAEAVKKWG